MTTIPYLEKAIRKTPLQEELYEKLLDPYLKSGYPSNAFLVFRQAETFLRRKHCTKPGARLTAIAENALIGII